MTQIAQSIDITSLCLIRYADNPSNDLLRVGQAHNILKLWRRFRYNWVNRDVIAQVVAGLDIKQVFIEMLLLLEKLREAMSLTRTIASEGILIENNRAGDMRNVTRDTTRKPLLL